MKNAKTMAALSLAAIMGTALIAPMAANAQESRQRDKNTTRNIGIGLGSAAVIEAIRGKNTNALLLGAGAAYAIKKSEDARKAQSRESRASANALDLGGPINVKLDGDEVAFPDAKPSLMGDRVYVPLRGVLEDMGANVKWDPSAKRVTAVKGGKTVVLPANGEATVNGDEVTLDAPAYVEGGRVMVPLRFFAETFGADVGWNAGERLVNIKSA